MPLQPLPARTDSQKARQSILEAPPGQTKAHMSGASISPARRPILLITQSLPHLSLRPPALSRWLPQVASIVRNLLIGYAVKIIWEMKLAQETASPYALQCMVTCCTRVRQ